MVVGKFEGGRRRLTMAGPSNLPALRLSALLVRRPAMAKGCFVDSMKRATSAS